MLQKKRRKSTNKENKVWSIDFGKNKPFVFGIRDNGRNDISTVNQTMMGLARHCVICESVTNCSMHNITYIGSENYNGNKYNYFYTEIKEPLPPKLADPQNINTKN